MIEVDSLLILLVSVTDMDSLQNQNNYVRLFISIVLEYIYKLYFYLIKTSTI